MEAKLIEILKSLGIFPNSGFGCVTINLNNGKIVNVEIKESKKIE